ncbi:hypothetical protein NFI96_029383 [Prochilodus magdalenae]|nr:hypothetical protein NFI96_029383 [Prochilodus magdalenae]
MRFNLWRFTSKYPELLGTGLPRRPAASMDSIPVIDFGAYRLGVNDVTDDKLHSLSEEVKTALTEIGFVYLTNTGIDEEEVEHVRAISKKFFLLPEEKKRPFSRGSFSNVNHGWVSLGTESLNPRRPGDLKEAFNITSLRKDIEWPSGELDEFRAVQESFFLRCKELSLRVLRVMALSLGLRSDYFLKAHTLIGSEENGTTLRSLYYPPVKSESVKDGQIRCGEHSDYGSITLVFQSQGGLQVLNREEEFISVPSIPGAVLVNIADLMQRWTSDVFVSAVNIPIDSDIAQTNSETSTVHRVLLPPANDSSTRQSLAFFVQPDDDAIITCCDGSNKYPPVNSLDYLLAKFKNTYGAN